MNFLGPLAAFGASLTWAIGSTNYSKISRDYSAYSVNFTRAFVAFPIFVFAAFAFSGGIQNGLEAYRQVQWSHWGWYAVSMIASYGLGDSIFLLSTQVLGVPAALAIASAFPIWTVIAGCLFANETVGLQSALGMIVTVSGLITVILNAPKDSSGSASPQQMKAHRTKGLILAFLTSFMWAANSFSTSRAGIDLHPAVGGTVRMIWGMVFCALFGKLLGPKEPICIPWDKIRRNLWVFFLEAFGGTYVYVYGLSHSPLALGATLASLAPVISVPIALMMGMEKFSLKRTFGVTIVVVGVALLLSGQ